MGRRAYYGCEGHTMDAEGILWMRRAYYGCGGHTMDAEGILWMRRAQVRIYKNTTMLGMTREGEMGEFGLL
jgi:hypothetical protein